MWVGSPGRDEGGEQRGEDFTTSGCCPKPGKDISFQFHQRRNWLKSTFSHLERSRKVTMDTAETFHQATDVIKMPLT